MIRIFTHVTARPLCLIIPSEMLVVGKIMEFLEYYGEDMTVLVSKCFTSCHGDKKNYK